MSIAILGMLGLGQIVFLPGYLLLRALRLGTGIVTSCILSFALGLVVNHVLVAGLVVLGLYRPAVVYAVFAAELLLLLAVERRRLRIGFAEAVAGCRQRAGKFFFAVENSDLLPSPSGKGRRVGPASGAPGRAPCTHGRGRERRPTKMGFPADHGGPALATRSCPTLPSPSGRGAGGEGGFYALPQLFRHVLLAAAVLVIAGFALSGIVQVGQVFQQWDAVVSWNRWAIDWAANRLPSATSYYPQLLPTNISLSYVFMQNSEVWIFAKAFQFLFCLTLLLAILDLARVEGQFGYVPGVAITYGLLVALLRFRMLAAGYADVPVAFFGFSAVYALALARNTADTRQRTKFLIVGTLLAVGAALTKQSGLYVAAIYPVLAWRFVLGRDPPPRVLAHYPGLRRRVPRPWFALAGICATVCLLVLPWYLYKFFDFRAGCDSNNATLLLVDCHQGRDLLHRLFHAGNTAAAATTPLAAVLVLIAASAALRNPWQRWLIGLLVAPLGLAWALALSYDLRNLALIVPFIGSAAGIGFMQIVSWVAGLGRVFPSRSGRGAGGEGRLLPSLSEGVTTRRMVGLVSFGSPYGYACSTSTSGTAPRPGFLRVGHVGALLTFVLIAACLCVSNDRLLAWQQGQQRKAGIPELNGRLYAYAASHPGGATIATDYQALRWLPDLGPRSMPCTCRELSTFRQTFDRPEVRYALVWTNDAAADVRTFLESRSVARLVFESHGFAFYEKCPGTTSAPAGLVTRNAD